MLDLYTACARSAFRLMLIFPCIRTVLFATNSHNTMDMVIYSGPSVVSVVEVSLRVIKTNNKILSYDWGRIVKNSAVRTNRECVYRERGL